MKLSVLEAKEPLTLTWLDWLGLGILIGTILLAALLFGGSAPWRMVP